MSILFRFKNGDLFKNRHHMPVLSSLRDLQYYTNCKYRGIKIILDWRQLSIDDFKLIYQMLNDNNDVVYKCDTNVDGIVNINGIRKDVRYQMWINHVPGDFYNELWYKIRDVLFQNIYEDIHIACDDSDILKLAAIKRDTTLIDLHEKNKLVDVNIFENDVYTNLTKNTTIVAGDRSIDGSVMIRRYDLTKELTWLVVVPKYGTATIYANSATGGGFHWLNYIGNRHEYN